MLVEIVINYVHTIKLFYAAVDLVWDLVIDIVNEELAGSEISDNCDQVYKEEHD